MAEAAEPPGPAGPPSRLLASPVMLLIALGRIAREELDDVLAGDGLSLRHLGALGHLRRTPRLSYSGLGRRAGVTAQSMQATVSHLERIGAVSRSDATGRGRAADLTVTSAGVAALERAEAAIAVVENWLLASIPGDDRAALTATLLHLTRAVWPR